MNISETCIRRPVLTTLLTASLIAFGAFAYRLLPVAALPAVDFPTIQITASLPGASPETMAASVASPIERQLSTISGISSMSSSSSLGSTQITVQFDLNRNIDGAALDVQTALSVAQKRLPIEMTTPPSFRKVNPGDFAVLYLSLRSGSMPLSKVDDYAETVLAPTISQLNGVSQVLVYGAQKFAVRSRGRSSGGGGPQYFARYNPRRGGQDQFLDACGRARGQRPFGLASCDRRHGACRRLSQCRCGLP